VQALGQRSTASANDGSDRRLKFKKSNNSTISPFPITTATLLHVCLVLTDEASAALACLPSLHRVFPSYMNNLSQSSQTRRPWSLDLLMQSNCHKHKSKTITFRPSCMVSLIPKRDFLTDQHRHLNESIRIGESWQACNSRRIDVQAQIDALQELESELLKESRAFTLSKREEECFASEHIATVAQPQCRELCAQLFTKLPRELRDMVCKHVVDEIASEVTVTRNSYACDKSKGWFCFEPHECARGICVEHFMRQEYVGVGIQREMIEAWLSRTRFILGISLKSDLSTQLQSDRWGIGLPAHQYISQIDLRDIGIGEGTHEFYLDVLAVVKPTARVRFVVSTSHKKQMRLTNGTNNLREIVERQLSRYWRYIRVMDRSRVEFVFLCRRVGKSIALGPGGATLKDWKSDIDKVSRRLVWTREAEALTGCSTTCLNTSNRRRHLDGLSYPTRIEQLTWRHRNSNKLPQSHCIGLHSLRKDDRERQS
jgi:hypothetical protein